MLFLVVGLITLAGCPPAPEEPDTEPTVVEPVPTVTAPPPPAEPIEPIEEPEEPAVEPEEPIEEPEEPAVEPEEPIEEPEEPAVEPEEPIEEPEEPAVEPEEPMEEPEEPAVEPEEPVEEPEEPAVEPEEPVEEPEEPAVDPEEPVEEPEEPAEEPEEAAVSLDDPLSFARVPTPVWMPEPIEVEDAAAETEEEMKPYTETIPDTDVTFDMVPIPGGTFLMGSPEEEEDRRDDEGPQVEIEIEPFWMGKHEVTWSEFELWSLALDKQRREMTGVDQTERHELIDAIAIPTKPYTDMTFGMGKDGYPAICMTQTAAKMYCKWLSAKTGRYYRLPTEAEWEYAARAGTTTAYSFGDDPEDLDDYGWHFENSNDRYHRVGQLKPNPWGLYDMHGNVAEWVIDQHVPDFYAQLKEKQGPLNNPIAHATRLYPRVVRGGSWDDDPEDLRSAARAGSTTDWMLQDPQIPQSPWYHTDANFVGFRVVRPLRVPTPEEAKRYELDEVQITELEEYRDAQAGQW